MISPSLPPEYLDVVDAQDKVIDCQLRTDVHRLGLCHRAVHILVFNLQGDIYLQQRSLQKSSFPNCWDSSAAGHVDAGEDYLQAAQRELEEELQVVEPLEALFKLDASPITTNEFCFVYKCITTQTPVPDRVEIAQAGWFTPAFVAEWIQRESLVFTPIFRIIWGKLSKSS